LTRLAAPVLFASLAPTSLARLVSACLFAAWRRLPRGLIVPLLVGLPLVGCVAKPPPAAPRPGHQLLKVMTSVLPVTLFTRTVAAGCARVEALVPANVGPHDWQASPADLARLSQADVLVINGLGLESHLDKLIEASGNRRLRQIDSSRGVIPIANPAPGTDHAPASGHPPASGHADHADEHGPLNPHIWLDPRRAAQQVATIRDGLIAADPACGSRYRANAAALLAELERLDRDLARQFAPHAGRPLLMFHAVIPYFAQRYRLRSEALVEDPEQSPSATDLQRFSRSARQSGVRALVSEPQASSKAFNALASDLGLPLVRFDPIETAPAAPGLSASFYLDTMRRNGAQLLQALGR
jgi:zinc/manganese transport system substrate-binding protein